MGWTCSILVKHYLENGLRRRHLRETSCEEWSRMKLVQDPVQLLVLMLGAFKLRVLLLGWT